MHISINLLAVSRSDELFDALSKMSDAGHAEATYHLGMLYNNGIGVDKSPSKAFELFKVAARNGDVLGHYKVGCYYAGQFGEFQGITLSKDKTLEHKLVAANAGYSLAHYDVATAIEWTEKAGDQGHIQSLSSLLSLYLAPDSEFKSEKDAYLVTLKIEKLVPNIKRLEQIESDLETKLSSSDINQASVLASNWKPEVS